MDLAPQNRMSAAELVAWALHTHGDRCALVTSFQDEGMVLLDMAAAIDPRVRVITLDTGRLPAETFDIIETVRQRYGLTVELVAPDPAETETMGARFGPNLFYGDRTLRLLCCQVRKVRPLARKLAWFDAFLVGLRRGQSAERADTPQAALEDGRLKLSPLAAWSKAEVAAYLAERGVPRHPLYGFGYASIGCAPCTRAIREGEGERAGRWWWEEEGARECGLHFTPEGRIERRLDVLLREVTHAPA